VVLDRYGTWEASLLWGLWGEFINSKKSLIQNSQEQRHDKHGYISFSLAFLILSKYYAKLSARSILLNMPNDVVKVMITVVR